ncbi:MAG TPA: c-type cytochrome [Xanthomonadaceae bacterium]|nr:c-type cytochrome [Xanthomonadaceae bacterium]
MRSQDISFLKHFSMILAALVVVTVALILVAGWIYEGRPREESLAAIEHTTQRLQPVGRVYAGETGAAAMAAAAAAAQQAASAQVAYGGTLEGEVIYNSLCGTCHNSGAGGAPLMTAEVWAPRIDRGMEALVRNAITGYQGEDGIMPPKGGNPALTDAQVEAAVLWMVEQIP